MQYAVTVIIEADNLKNAILKVPDDLGEVASAVPRPPQNQSGGSITRSQFQKSQTQPTPMVVKS